MQHMAGKDSLRLLCTCCVRRMTAFTGTLLTTLCHAETSTQPCGRHLQVSSWCSGDLKINLASAHHSIPG